MKNWSICAQRGQLHQRKQSLKCELPVTTSNPLSFREVLEYQVHDRMPSIRVVEGNVPWETPVTLRAVGEENEIREDTSLYCFISKVAQGRCGIVPKQYKD
jgi:hypothetical protein